MTDQDRGAYTPFADEPLSFDPRESGRRPMPMTLVVSGLVLVGLVGGVGLIYRNGVRHAGPDENAKVVGQPVLKVKSAAAPAPPPKRADQALDVYGAPNDATAAGAPAPNFAPAPEQPAPRVAVLPPAHAPQAGSEEGASEYADAAGLTTKAASDAAEPAAKAKIAAAATTAPSSQTHAADATASTATGTSAHSKRQAHGKAEPATAAAAPRTDADAAKPAKAGPKKSAAAARTETAEAGGAADAGARSSGPVVQIGAFSSNAQAARGWNDMAALMADRMGGKTKHVLKIEKGGQTFYRTWVAGFGSRTDAQAFCDALKAKGKACLVKG